ncbi:MAG TPA: hypothetical protein VIS74_04745 [Chthoniobacterales bacterium]
MKIILAILLAGAAGFIHAADDSVKPYPLTVCAVSGAKLGTMGEPVVRVYDGQEVKFCCGGCIAMFEADPAKYLKQVRAAENK